ncbi:MAG TPA: peptidylprolyl isomerase [Blastocatellia bacterium]|nr:peptidylprolyl isomerase [Blastocatellia bacterium]
MAKSVIAAIAVVVLLAGGLLFAQWNASPKAGAIKLTAQDMEVLVNDIFPPGQAQQLASNPEQKKDLANRLKEMFALAQVAEQEGYASKPEVQSQIALQSDLTLQDVYQKRNPDAKATDEEVEAYYKANPDAFDKFLDLNPQYKAQAQGPQGESIKKEFGQIKVVADRARKEGLEQDQVVKLRLLLERSQALARAYVTDLQQNADKLVTDAEVEQYYREHPQEFEEIKARHILISTQPEQHGEDDGHGHSKEELKNQPKPLSKEEARKKAQGLLERARKGEDFVKLAKENSDEPGAEQSGGDLGFFARGAMVPAFEQAAFALQPGQLSEVVETNFGFHVIKVEERRTTPIDDPAARKKVADKLKTDKVKKRIEEIAANSKVEVAEDFNIKPAPAPAAPALPTPAPEGAQPGEQK